MHNIILDTATIILGILFFLDTNISWVILYILLLAVCLAEPILTVINGRKLRPNDYIDGLLTLLALSVGSLILFFPSDFKYNMHILAGIWMLATAFLSAVNCVVILKDRQPHFMRTLLYTLYCVFMGLFLILGSKLSLKTWLLSLFAGFFFFTQGLRSLIIDLGRKYPNSRIAKIHWSLSLPLILSAFIPMGVWIRVHTNDDDIPDAARDKADLYVFIYMKGGGFERFGHIDIGYQGKIYSYGCHDPENRTLAGTFGDGVLIVSDQERFLRHAMYGEHKTVIAYGLKCKDEEKAIIEERIKNMMNRTVPWQPKYQRTGSDQDNDYASRVWKDTKASFFKFSSGRFRTYFVASTNCVLLADELIRGKNLNLISLSGFVTPGSYLEFLNTAYEQNSPVVISRRVLTEKAKD